LRGPFGDNKQLFKGLDFLLKESRLPTVLVKEMNLRKIRKANTGKSYKWLFVFDRAHSSCHQILRAFMQLLDKNLDSIDCLTLLPSFICYDDVRNYIYKEIESEGMNPENIKYEVQEYQHSPSKIVNEKINFGETIYDYLVFYNNPEKYRNSQKSADDVLNMVKFATCNICFINGGIYKIK